MENVIMLRKYYSFYSKSKMKNKLAKIFKRVSQKAFREVITLMVMLKSDKVPTFAKVSIMCVLGYLICPLDAIPDFLPIGLLDDFAAIAVLMTEMSIYRTPEIENKVDKIAAMF
jgi:uncharacterized membrane protein YkvA (DUF1232 family)